MTWTLHPASEFSGHAADWQRINDAASRTPLLATDFVAPLLAAFGRGGELLALHAAGGGITAMAIVTMNGKGKWETFQPSQAPLGMWVQLPGQDVQALLQSLLRALPGLPLVLGLSQCDPALLPRPAESPTLRTLDYIRTARITISGSFDDYWNARGKNLRNNLKKQRAKLQKDGIEPRVQVVRAAADMDAAVADYGRLESAGWKAQGGTAIHPDNDQGLFYRLMLSAFAARGAAAVYRYWFGQQLVAMDLCIEGDGSFIILKTTYDETVPNNLSPTLLMREEVTRQLFEEGRIGRIEFYGKVMEWHTRWTDEIRTMYHVTLYRWTALPGLKALKAQSAQLLRRLHAPRPAASPAASPTPSQETTE